MAPTDVFLVFKVVSAIYLLHKILYNNILCKA